MEPPCDIVGSAEKRQRWEKNHRQWSKQYADAQAQRVVNLIRNGVHNTSTFDAEFFPSAADEPALSDEDFLAKLRRIGNERNNA
jgi:hypothetical protein